MAQQSSEITAKDVEVPPGAPSWITAELIAYTLRVWQPQYDEHLTEDEAVEILWNVSRLWSGDV